MKISVFYEHIEKACEQTKKEYVRNKSAGSTDNTKND